MSSDPARTPVIVGVGQVAMTGRPPTSRGQYM